MRTPRSAGLSRRKTEYIKQQNESQYGKYRAITNKKIPQQTLRDKDCRFQVTGFKASFTHYRASIQGGDATIIYLIPNPVT